MGSPPPVSIGCRAASSHQRSRGGNLANQFFIMFISWVLPPPCNSHKGSPPFPPYTQKPQSFWWNFFSRKKNTNHTTKKNKKTQIIPQKKHKKTQIIPQKKTQKNTNHTTKKITKKTTNHTTKKKHKKNTNHTTKKKSTKNYQILQEIGLRTSQRSKLLFRFF